MILKLNENEINEIVDVALLIVENIDVVEFVEFDEFDEFINYTSFKFLIENDVDVEKINYIIKKIELNFMNYELNIDYVDDFIIVKIIDVIRFNPLEYNIDNFICLLNKINVLYSIKSSTINSYSLIIELNDEIDVDNLKLNIEYFFNRFNENPIDVKNENNIVGIYC